MLPTTTAVTSAPADPLLLGMPTALSTPLSTTALVWLVVSLSCVLVGVVMGIAWSGRQSSRTEPDRSTEADAPTVTRVVVVVNPTKVSNAQRKIVEHALRDAGATDVRFVDTTVADPGEGQARVAAETADVVVAWGGDGTVRNCVAGMSGMDTPLAVLPGGTGNLLARNLDLPSDLVAAAAVAMHGARRRIDVGVASAQDAGGSTFGEPTVDEPFSGEPFAVIAGIGFDAVLLRDAPEHIKARIGAIAYVLSGLRNLRGPGFRARVVCDDVTVRRRVQTVLIGNVGKLQAGLPMLPDASPDDGLLDVVVISPRTHWEWFEVAVRVIFRRPHRMHTETLRGRHVEVETEEPQPYQLDGDVRVETTRLVCNVEPQSLVLCVPHGSY